MPSREPELYKDKVEVSLDGRQIFYLFFGGAVIVGLVFVLGVLVGRRVEARGHIDRAQTQTETDPLAALDRLERSDHLSFQGALRGSEAPTDVEKAISELEKRRAARKPEADKKVEAEKKPDADKKPETDKKPEADKKSETEKKPAADKVEQPITHPEADKPRTEKRSETAASEKKKHDEESKEPKGKFTLQLSSFQDRSEAEGFLNTVKSAGYQPYLVEADVTGKGTFYRVRLGSYRSLEAANDAKAEYDKSAKKAAQVTRL